MDLALSSAGERQRDAQMAHGRATSRGDDRKHSPGTRGDTVVSNRKPSNPWLGLRHQAAIVDQLDHFALAVMHDLKDDPASLGWG